MRDRVGTPLPGDWGESTYEHDFARHGWFPLMLPQEPDALDRLWTWARIRQEARPFRGPERLCWRVDFVDPALPTEAEEVQCWFHADVPVFGLQEWHRGGRIWTLVSWRAAGEK